MNVNAASPLLRSQLTTTTRGPEERVELDGTALPGLDKCVRQDIRSNNEKAFGVSVLLKGDDASGVEAFAKKNGLNVTDVDSDTHTVKLEGTAANYNKAFGVELNDYKDPANGKTFRGYEGNVSLPKGLSGSVDNVLGLSNRPIAQPRNTGVRVLADQSGAGNGPSPNGLLGGGYNPVSVANAYNFPKGTDGTGQDISIVELGGGFQKADLDNYFQKLGIKSPNVSVVSVDGGQNAPENNPNGADGEVDLDIEVAGSVAPGANIKVYFAPNSDQGFVDAVNQATADQVKEGKPGAVSISWGSAESQWEPAAVKSFDAALQNSAKQGVNVYSASGDDGSVDGVKDGKNHADFPASSPWNISTGGTQLKLDSNGNRSAEKAWGGGFFGGAGGGGFSTNFPAPDFQKDALQGVASQNPGNQRGVPDISGNADPATGYDVLVDGKEASIGGTSAVAPLMAALNARLGQGLGEPTGYLNPFFYAHPQDFNDITKGTNGAFHAGPGWDATTGLGTPNGEALLADLKKAHAQA